MTRKDKNLGSLPVQTVRTVTTSPDRSILLVQTLKTDIANPDGSLLKLKTESAFPDRSVPVVQTGSITPDTSVSSGNVLITRKILVYEMENLFQDTKF